MFKVPENYLLNKFYSYSHEPTFKKYDGVYNAGCPICKEGKSLGKKKRLFFYPKTQSFYCFNCNKSWSSISWLASVTGMSVAEIKNEILTDKNSFEITTSKQQKVHKKTTDLPFDSINLCDPIQLSYYCNDNQVINCLNYIKQRRLDTATNKSKNFYISLKDFIHKNRLCIPFYDENKKILFYQTRSLDGSMPKYLSKQGSEKSIFNFDKIDQNYDYIFMLEGPIDAMFIKNGIAIAGINLTQKQESQLSRYPLHQKIWILDNPRIDNTAQKKIQELLQRKEKVYCWNNEYKDLNEWCVTEKLNEIDTDCIINSLYI